MAKNNLNKSEMEHVQKRVTEIVQCTNGEIATTLNRIEKGTGLTPQRKYRMIRDGQAVILPEKELVDRRRFYNCDSFYDNVSSTGGITQDWVDGVLSTFF